MRYLILSVFLGLVVLIPPPLHAQSGNITVKPQIIELDLSEDEPEAEFTYSNNTDAPIELTLSIEDIRELEENGVPGFVAPQERSNYKYGLTSWASLSNPSVLLQPGEEKKVTVFIDKTRLTLGGHYASILAEITQVSDNEHVELKGIFSSFLFVRSGSEFEVEKGTILTLRPKAGFIEFPEEFLMRFQNNGNVDVKPFGRIELTDIFGNTVATGIVNNASSIVLPESVRSFDVPLERTQRFIFPGLYNAEVSLHFGKTRVTRNESYAFFTQGDIDLKSLLGATVIAGVFLILLKRRKKD